MLPKRAQQNEVRTAMLRTKSVRHGRSRRMRSRMRSVAPPASRGSRNGGPFAG